LTEGPLLDLVFITLMLAFFALAAACIAGCQRIG
jgi:hypothetical protein